VPALWFSLHGVEVTGVEAVYEVLVPGVFRAGLAGLGVLGGLGMAVSLALLFVCLLCPARWDSNHRRGFLFVAPIAVLASDGPHSHGAESSPD
jgi:hypothetical protein